MLSSMAVTQVIRSGNSQAVRIPWQFRLHSEEVEIFRRDDEIVLRERPRNLAQVFELLTGLSPDFLKGGRRQPRPQKKVRIAAS
jgi:antitoxin VapB